MKIFNLKQLCLTILAIFILSQHLVYAKNWPKFPFPKKAKISVVADDMVMNGIPMHAWELRSRKSLKYNLDFYRKTWEGEGADGHVEDKMGKWTVISRKEGRYFFTVKLAGDKYNAYGYLGVTLLPKEGSKPRQLGKYFLKLPSTQVLTDMVSTDLGRQSQTLILQNSSSVQVNRQFYIDEYKKDGWINQSGNKEAPFLLMKRGGSELNITFSIVNGKTNMVVVQVGE